MTLPCFVSDDERAWYAATPTSALSQSEATLQALVLGQDVSMLLLAWAYFHAEPFSVVKELLRERIRRALGMSM